MNIIDDAQRVLDNATDDPEGWAFWLKCFGSSMVTEMVRLRELNTEANDRIAALEEALQARTHG